MERHMKKVFDCLNIGCNKKAVQEVDRLPKNVRDQPVFKSLKALALIRMFKRRQAFDILDDINLAKDKLDDVTIQTMTSCYKESLEVAKIVELCEAAAKSKPLDQDVLYQLFMAYARVFNFKRQKEIAVKLYQNFENKSRVFTVWAIISLVMQAEEASTNNPTDRMVCLGLAEKMCDKKIIDEKSTNEEIELYLTILRKQNKFEDEYRFLTGPILPRVSDHLSWFNRRRAFLCLELKMYSRAFKHYFPTLIQEYPDQLEYYQGLFRSAFLLDTEAPSQQQPVASNTDGTQSINQSNLTPVKSTSALAECLDIVERQMFQIIENNENSKDQQKSKNQIKSPIKATSLNVGKDRRLLRGPCIARVELYHLILSNEHTIPKSTFLLCKNQFSTKYPSLNDLLLEFFQNFSRKIICFYDMTYMISEYKLNDEDKKILVENIGHWVDDQTRKSQSGDLSAMDTFFIKLNHHLLEHSIRPYKPTDSREDRLKIVTQYIDLYNSNRHLARKNETEFLPIDAYCLLAINAMMTNSVQPNDTTQTNGTFLTDGVLMTLIVITEIAINNSVANHQLKLLLLKLYSLIGVSKQCSSVIFKLDVKHFQIDTLGHLLNPVLYNTGNYNNARESLETCSEFYGHGIRECFDGLTQSYKDGRFSKVCEITSILKRLSNSLNFTQCILLKGIVSTIMASSSDDLEQCQHSFDPFRGLQRMFPVSIDEEKPIIRDNRDFKVLRSLHIDTTQLIVERKTQTIQDDTLWLKLRYYIIRSVYMQQELIAASSCTNSKKNKQLSYDCDNDPEKLRQLTENIESLKIQIFEIVEDENKRKDYRYSYLEPESTPLRWQNSIDIKLLLDLVTPLLSIVTTSALTAKISDEYNSNMIAIIDSIEKQVSTISSLIQMKQALLTLTLSIEFITMAVTSLYYIGQMVKGASASSTANASNHQQQQQQTESSKAKTITNQMINKSETHLTRLSNLIKNIDPKTIILDKITSVDAQLASSNNEQSSNESCPNKNSPINQLLDAELCKTTLARVKTDIIESYTDSLREIENVCRRKIKLLKS